MRCRGHAQHQLPGPPDQHKLVILEPSRHGLSLRQIHTNCIRQLVDLYFLNSNSARNEGMYRDLQGQMGT